VGTEEGGKMESAVAMIKIDGNEYALEDISKWAGGAVGELESNPYEIIEALSGLLIRSAHPAFLKFLGVCNGMKFGTIKELKVQNRLPNIVFYDIKTELDAVVEVSKKLV